MLSLQDLGQLRRTYGASQTSSATSVILKTLPVSVSVAKWLGRSAGPGFESWPSRCQMQPWTSC